MAMTSLLLTYDIDGGLMDRAWCGAELMLGHSLASLNVAMSVPRDFVFRHQYGFDVMHDILPDPTKGKVGLTAS